MRKVGIQLRWRQQWRQLIGLLFIIFSLTGALAQRQDLVDSAEGRATVFDALVSVLAENYWNPDYRDWETWAQDYRQDALAAPSRYAFDRVARRMISDLDDDHSSWVGLVRYVDSEDDSDPNDRGLARRGLGFQHEHLNGVGVVVLRVYPQTPAYEAGLRRGDVIVRVNNTDVVTLTGADNPGRILATAVSLGDVTLSVERRAQTQTLSVVPAPVAFEAVQQLPQAQMLDDSTGYLYIPTFNTARVADEVHYLISDLQAQGASALVLDLRGNLGGRLSELGLVLGAFVQGPLARAVSRGSVAWQSSYEVVGGEGYSVLTDPSGVNLSELTLASPVRFDGPLAVLVDSRNSSAGEIAPLVLQSMGRATVIGEQTSGNVEAVRGFDLPDGSLVMVAVANLESIDGSTFDDGVRPDIVASTNIADLARGFDAPVAEALRIVKSLPFTPGRFF